MSEDVIRLSIRREFVDFNGLTDYPSLHDMITSLHPSEIICWHGLPSQQEFLFSHLQQDNYAVVRAGNLEKVEIQSHNSIEIMRLDERLLAALPRQKVGEYEVE